MSAHKWTKTQRANFLATMKRKREDKAAAVAKPGRQLIPDAVLQPAIRSAARHTASARLDVVKGSTVEIIVAGYHVTVRAAR